MKQFADLLLGRIAVEKSFVTAAQVQDCLKKQAANGAQPLGNIMVDEGLISAAQRDELVRRQEQAFFSEINTLYGRLAQRNGLVNAAQVDECLMEQRRRYAQEGARTPPLGELMVARGYLKDRDHQALLHRQQDLLAKKTREHEQALRTAANGGASGHGDGPTGAGGAGKGGKAGNGASGGKGRRPIAKVSIPKPGTAKVKAADTLISKAVIEELSGADPMDTAFGFLDALAVQEGLGVELAAEDLKIAPAAGARGRPSTGSGRTDARPAHAAPGSQPRQAPAGGFQAPTMGGGGGKKAGDSLMIDFGADDTLELPTLALGDAPVEPPAPADDDLTLDFDALPPVEEAPRLRADDDDHPAPLRLDDEDVASLSSLAAVRSAPVRAPEAPPHGGTTSAPSPAKPVSEPALAPLAADEADFADPADATRFDLPLGDAVAVPPATPASEPALVPVAEAAELDFADLDEDFGAPAAGAASDVALPVVEGPDFRGAGGGGGAGGFAAPRVEAASASATLIDGLAEAAAADDEDVDIDLDAIATIDDDAPEAAATAASGARIENRFGRLAVEHGFCTEGQVLEALAEQERMRGRGKEMRLGALLTMRGYLTLAQVQRLVSLQDDSVLICHGCEAKYNISSFAPGHEFACARCQAVLVVPQRMGGDAPAARPAASGRGAGAAPGSSPTIIFDAPGDAAPPTRQVTTKAAGGSSAMTILFDQDGAPGGPQVQELEARPADSDAATLMAFRQPVVNIPRPQAAANALGDYEVIREIGRGAMGVVYEGVQKGLGRRVAIKVLPANFSTNEKIIQRFRREAAAVSKLNHPHIIPVYGMGEQDGTHFFAMEFVAGKSLEGFPDMATVEVERKVQWLLQAAQALAYAHKRKIIHRDIKPANLMITDEDDEVKVADFGLAREEESASMTKSGQIMGTPAYMSPEQARGSKGEVDHRTDQYSLGVTFYELLTQLRAFPGEDIHEVIRSVLEHDPPPVRKVSPKVPRDLATIVEKCMEKDQAKRYESCDALVEDLQRYQAGEPIAARPISGAERVWRKLKKHKAVAIVAVLAFAAVGVVSWFFVNQAFETQQRIDREYAEFMERGAQALAAAQALRRQYDITCLDLAQGVRAAADLMEEEQPEALARHVEEVLTQAVEQYTSARTKKEDELEARLAADDRIRLCKEQLAEAQRAEGERKAAAQRELAAQEAIAAARALAAKGLEQQAQAREETDFDDALKRLDDAKDHLAGAIGALPVHPDAKHLREEYSLAQASIVPQREKLEGERARRVIVARSETSRAEGRGHFDRAQAELALAREHEAANRREDAAAREKEAAKLLGKAVAMFDKAVAVFPENQQARQDKFEACLVYSELSLKRQEWSLARLFLDFAYATDVDNKRCEKHGLEIDRLDLLHSKYTKNIDDGAAALERHDWAAAERYYQDALAALGTQGETQPELVARAELGRREAEFGRLEGAAERLFEEAKKIDPARVRAETVIEEWDRVLTAYGAARAKAPSPRQQETVDQQRELCRTRKLDGLLVQARGKLSGRDWSNARTLAHMALDLDENHGEARALYREATYHMQTPERMVYLRAEEVTVGSNQSSDHNPARTVALAACYLGAYEVTNQEFAAFVAASGYETPAYWTTEAFERRDRFVDQSGRAGPADWAGGIFPEGQGALPVAGITFAEAKAFAAWKAAAVGEPWRLPTEDEWEAAASWTGRAQTIYPWGDEFNRDNGSFKLDAPVEVGTIPYDRNPRSLCFDMAGNVSEWTLAVGADGTAVPDEGVVKGFSYGFREQLVGALARLSRRVAPKDPWYRSTKIGLRLAREITDPDPAATDRQAARTAAE